MNLDALAVAVRFGLYLDLMLLFGGAVFRLHGLLAGAVGTEPDRKAIGAIAAALIGGVLSTLGLVLLAATMTGTPLANVDRDAMGLVLGSTAVGTAGIVRLLALVLVLPCALLGRWPRTSTSAVVLLGAVAIGTLAWSGHGAMDDGMAGWLHLGGDIVHLLAAGLWVGALAGLLRLALRPAPDHAHLRRVHDALERFSAIGIAVVLLVLLSGLINGRFLVGPAHIPGLWQTRWGQLMLAKLALFAAMLALAAVNRFRLTPALAEPAGPEALRHARLSLALETGAAALILLLVAWLGMMEPPAS